jgi:hypothetical protein
MTCGMRGSITLGYLVSCGDVVICIRQKVRMRRSIVRAFLEIGCGTKTIASPKRDTTDNYRHRAPCSHASWVIADEGRNQGDVSRVHVRAGA